MVHDECPGCGYGDLGMFILVVVYNPMITQAEVAYVTADMSPSAFSAIGDERQGVLNIDWSFMDKGWHP